MRRPENIETQEEKESDSAGITLKRHLMLEFCQIKGTGDILGPLRSLCDYVINFKDRYTGPVQRNQR